jgi:hypothetical protein
MPTKFFHHTELTPAHFSLDRPSDFIDTIASTGGFGGMMERTLSTSNQSIRRGRDSSDFHRNRSIRKEAVFFRYKIEFHQIACL